MRVKSPTVTLLTGAGLGIALLIASMLATAHAAGPSAPAPTRSPARAEGAGSSSPSPSPSPTSSALAKATISATYVAPVRGGGVAVVISVSGARASAYVCRNSAVEARVSGTAVGGKLTLTGRDHAQLRATYNARKAVGDVLANGVRSTFSAAMVRKSSAEHESVRSRCEGESRIATRAGQGGGQGGDDHGGGGHGGGGHGGGGGD
jgi:hypothetical protein